MVSRHIARRFFLSLVSLVAVFAFSLPLPLSGGSTLSSGVALAQANTATVSGTIKDNQSTPLVGAQVQVIEPATQQTIVSAATDSAGYYTLSTPTGTYDVKGIPPAGSGFQSFIFLWYPITGNTILNFVLVPAGPATLSGKVLDPLGNSLPNQSVFLAAAILHKTSESDFDQAISHLRIEP